MPLLDRQLAWRGVLSARRHSSWALDSQATLKICLYLPSERLDMCFGNEVLYESV